jgi:hypothetical protein
LSNDQSPQFQSHPSFDGSLILQSITSRMELAAGKTTTLSLRNIEAFHNGNVQQQNRKEN